MVRMGFGYREAWTMGYVDAILVLDQLLSVSPATPSATAGRLLPQRREPRDGEIENRKDGTQVQHIRSVESLAAFLSGKMG